MFGFGKKEYFKPDADGSVPVIVFTGQAGAVKVYDVPVLVGRDQQTSDVQINDPTVSRKHFLINTYNDKYTVTDQGSTAGTIINGETLEPGIPYYLSDGDKVTIGKLKFVCHINRDHAGKKLKLPSFMERDTARDTSDMNKEDLKAAEEAENAEELIEPAEEVEDVEELIEPVEDVKDVEELIQPAEEQEQEPVINLMPDPVMEEDETPEEEESEPADSETAEDEPSDEEPAADESADIEPAESETAEEFEDLFEPTKDVMASDEKYYAGQEHVGRPKFVYYSGNVAVESFVISGTPFVVGRAKADYTPGAAGVSRKHCFIDRTGNMYYITDLESTNGVWINGRRIKPYNRTALVNGDIVGIGDRVYKFEWQ